MNSVLEKIRSFFLKPLPKFFFPISCILFVYVVIMNSWVTEDAYISLRKKERIFSKTEFTTSKETFGI
ncbi:hypothetical protein [Leptospira haakeii]|uniref:hypothetical protein n=1 Tax=Leptospira haakeii TaxID=2023198 RepID=UPI0013FD8424|nr:hypothetical protein [Leptospira haakeii]